MVLVAYKKLDSAAPSCRLWLDGAHAREDYSAKAAARIQGDWGQHSGPAQVALVSMQHFRGR